VADERDLLHLDRPSTHHLLEQLAQRLPVLRDVAAGVVPNVDRGRADVACQAVPVALARGTPEPLPAELGPHEAVHEHDKSWRSGGEGLSQSSALGRDEAAIDAHGHRLGQIAALLQGVAD
jgi:hypothetical protein